LKRRNFLIIVGGLALFTTIQLQSRQNRIAIKASADIEKWQKSDEFWRETLTPTQYAILRNGATEPRYSSKYAKFYENGIYSCQGCDLDLFSADMKYDSKTGWPSFSDHIHGHLETYTDLKGMWPQTGYRCARCSGHHGHLIMDGPLPTGQRWCNNGQVLKFRSV
jgi:peptide-methionine (R)-S-oxide reductase